MDEYGYNFVRNLLNHIYTLNKIIGMLGPANSVPAQQRNSAGVVQREVQNSSGSGVVNIVRTRKAGDKS